MGDRGPNSAANAPTAARTYETALRTRSAAFRRSRSCNLYPEGPGRCDDTCWGVVEAWRCELMPWSCHATWPRKPRNGFQTLPPVRRSRLSGHRRSRLRPRSPWASMVQDRLQEVTVCDFWQHLEYEQARHLNEQRGKLTPGQCMLQPAQGATIGSGKHMSCKSAAAHSDVCPGWQSAAAQA